MLAYIWRGRISATKGGGRHQESHRHAANRFSGDVIGILLISTLFYSLTVNGKSKSETPLKEIHNTKPQHSDLMDYLKNIFHGATLLHKTVKSKRYDYTIDSTAFPHEWLPVTPRQDVITNGSSQTEKESQDMTSNYIKEDEIYFLRNKVSGKMLPEAVTVCAGEDIRIRLVNVTGSLTKCSVKSPTGTVIDLFPRSVVYSQKANPRVIYWDSGEHGERCGFRINQVTKKDTGRWNLSAITEEIHMESIVTVKVSECNKNYNKKSALLPGDNIYANCGWERTAYCKLHAPNHGGTIGGNKPPSMVYGACKIPSSIPFNNLVSGEWSCGWIEEGSTMERSSTTSLSYLTHSKVDSGVKWRNSTGNESTNDVVLWCNTLYITRALKVCRWVRPDGKVFYMKEGLASDRYGYYGQMTTDGQCGISIEQPLKEEDIGVWRCELYQLGKGNLPIGGFLEVGVAKRSREDKAKTLRAWGSAWDRSGSGAVVGVSGRPLSIGCSANASLHFCFLRHPNGTRIIPPPPTNSEDGKPLVLAGQGTYLGDCGVTVAEASVKDTGIWECVVGVDHGEGSTISIDVRVHESSLSAKTVNAIRQNPITLTCESVLGEALEHCRFERPDRTMFTVADVRNLESQRATWKSGLRAVSNLTDGICSATLSSIANSDIGEWKCFAVIQGYNNEVMATFVVNEQGVAVASSGTISAIVVTIIVVLAIGTVVYLKVYKKRRNRTTLRGANVEQPPPSPARAVVNFRRSSDESSEGSENGR